ncbi:MAG: Cache sensor protein, partial [Algoriphagus sp.]|nr:Cache sensor protein [Algoriphagus sp.]
SAELDRVAHQYEFLVQNSDSILAKSGALKYTFEGPFSTNLPDQDSSLSSIIILNTTSDRKKAEEEVRLTNSLDSLFRVFIKKNRMAVQIYSNSAMQVSRVYPAYDVKNIVDPGIDVTNFNFYYEADSAHNPSRGLVWIPDAYVDPAGKGWILSLVHPIYKGDQLFAVLGVDFTVSTLIQNYLESVEGNFILVNGKGDIVAAKGEATEFLGMPPLKNHVYRETIQADNFRISDFNLFHSKSAEVRQMAQALLFEKKNSYEFTEEANLKSAIGLSFKKIDWYLIELFPEF